MRVRIAILVTTALAPFVASFIEPIYIILVYYSVFTFPVSLVSGLAWLSLFLFIYFHAETEERERLRWWAALAIFAFILPIHLLLLMFGVPPFLPRDFTPS